jgi:hypothetical protein
MTPCDEVTERLALGEPLGDVEDHVATCPACSRLVGLPRLVAASAHAAEPNPGFVIRSTAGARTLLVRRRRNRIIGNGVAAAAVLALAVWAVRSPIGGVKQNPLLPQASMPSHNPEPINTPNPTLLTPVTNDVIGTELKTISNFDRVMAPSRQWNAAQRPLSRYRIVVQGASR